MATVKTLEFSNPDAILLNLAKLVSSPKLADVILQTGPEGVAISAHSILLAAQSPFYHVALGKHWNQKESFPTVIEHPDVRVDVMDATLQYIYTGKIEMSDGILLNVLEFSDYLGINELFDLCMNGLQRYQHANQCIKLFPTNWIQDVGLLLMLNEAMIRYIVLSVKRDGADVMRWSILVAWAKAQGSSGWAAFLISALVELINASNYFEFTPQQYQSLVEPVLDAASECPSLHQRLTEIVGEFRLSAQNYKESTGTQGQYGYNGRERNRNS